MHWTIKAIGITLTLIGRVTLQVGVIIECALIDGEELMTLNPAVVRTLEFRIDTYF
jgi:hypothetical protein